MPTPTPDIVREVPHLAPRDLDANKGDFGRVLIVAGSRGMSCLLYTSDAADE